MTVATTQRGGGGHVERYTGGGSTGLAEVVEMILDKGLVIDVFIRVSLVGIEILTVDIRIVVASVDTFLRFAEATNRLDLYGKGKGGKDITELAGSMTRGVAKGKAGGVLDAVGEKIRGIGGSAEDDEEEEPAERPRRRAPARSRQKAADRE